MQWEKLSLSQYCECIITTPLKFPLLFSCVTYFAWYDEKCKIKFQAQNNKLNTT